MTEKRWLISQADLPLARELSQKTGLSLLLCTVLSARGVKSPAEVCALLDTSVDTLIDPFALSGIREAVDTIRDAIARRQRIAVYGDYDVDGVTATCLLIDCLRTLGDCLYYIPDRLTEGYGVHPDALCKLRDACVDLIITVDTGVTAVEEIALAYSLGMRVVITDHHECAGAVPDAEAVVDPKLPGCTYPFRELPVWVSFKLVCALLGDTHTALERYAELVCLGTVADVMPLRGEPRHRQLRSAQLPIRAASDCGRPQRIRRAQRETSAVGYIAVLCTRAAHQRRRTLRSCILRRRAVPHRR